MYDQINRKVDSFSKVTVGQKHGPLGVYAMRKKIMDGLSADYLQKSITRVREALVGKPELQDTLSALEACARTHSSVSNYQLSKLEGQTSTQRLAQCLPSWVNVHYSRLARQVMDGVKDKSMIGILLKPPTGGQAQIKYTEHLRELDGLADPIQALDKAVNAWMESTFSIGAGPKQAPHVGGGGGGRAPLAGGGQTPREEQDGEQAAIEEHCFE